MNFPNRPCVIYTRTQEEYNSLFQTLFELNIITKDRMNEWLTSGRWQPYKSNTAIVVQENGILLYGSISSTLRPPYDNIPFYEADTILFPEGTEPEPTEPFVKTIFMKDLFSDIIKTEPST